MDTALTDFVLNESVNIEFANFIKNLLTATILSFLIQLTYKKFSRSISNKDYFSKNFIVLGLTTCIVITIVKSSLALSLGLVGALSIVRFRAAIKEPEELVFLFLVIATGLGCGAGQIKITVIGILFILIVIVFYSRFIFNKNKNEKNSDSLTLNLISDKNYSGKILLEIIDVLNENCSQIQLESLSISDNQFVVNFNLTPLNLNSVDNISSTLKDHKNFTKIIFANNETISL